MIHCEDVIDDHTYPEILRKFVAFHRQPAIEILKHPQEEWPVLWATDRFGTPCRVVMASRLGDLGVNYTGDFVGYSMRWTVDELSDYRLQR